MQWEESTGESPPFFLLCERVAIRLGLIMFILQYLIWYIQANFNLFLKLVNDMFRRLTLAIKRVLFEMC